MSCGRWDLTTTQAQSAIRFSLGRPDNHAMRSSLPPARYREAVAHLRKLAPELAA